MNTSSSPEPQLFQRFPRLRACIAHVPLTTTPTPVEPLELPGGSGATPPPGGVWIKRDDRSGSLYGGNKVRKLEFLLAEAQRQGADAIWTMGALGSHHALATTLYARAMGLETHVLHFPQPVTPHVLTNLRAIIAAGAHLTLAEGMPRVPLRWLEERARWALTSRQRRYAIPAGGSSPLGALGFVEAGLELAAQVQRGEAPAPARVYVTCGTGGTHAGLWLGLRLGGLTCEVVGVRVVDVAFCHSAAVAALAWRTLRLLRAHDPGIPALRPTPAELPIRHAYFGAGYGVPTRRGQQAQALLEAGGVHLDPTYTAKTCAALLDELRRPHLRPDGPVLFWQTLSSVDIAPLAAQARLPEALPLPYQRLLAGAIT